MADWAALARKTPEDWLSDMLWFDEIGRRWYVENAYARRSFGIGDVVTESETGLLGADGNLDNPFRLPLGFKAATTDDARRMALAFACAISECDGPLAIS